MALSSDTAATSPLSFGNGLANVRRNKRGRKGGAWGNGRVQRLDVLLEGGEFEASKLPEFELPDFQLFRRFFRSAAKSPSLDPETRSPETSPS